MLNSLYIKVCYICFFFNFFTINLVIPVNSVLDGLLEKNIPITLSSELKQCEVSVSAEMH